MKLVLVKIWVQSTVDNNSSEYYGGFVTQKLGYGRFSIMLVLRHRYINVFTRNLNIYPHVLPTGHRDVKKTIK